jgi:hypothetical protein
LRCLASIVKRARIETRPLEDAGFPEKAAQRMVDAMAFAVWCGSGLGHLMRIAVLLELDGTFDRPPTLREVVLFDDTQCSMIVRA